MEDNGKSEKKHSFEEDGKASVDTVNNDLSSSMHVPETGRLSTSLFLLGSANSTHTEGCQIASSVCNALNSSNVVLVKEELSTNNFLDEGADFTHTKLQSSEFHHLSIPVQETESLNLLRSTDKPASSYGKSLESEFLSIPFQESGSSNIFRNTDEPTSPFFEDKLNSYSPIPASLPPADECQLCSRKFGGNFRQFNVTFCVDCSRFTDFQSCNTKDYKRPSGPPMTIF